MIFWDWWRISGCILTSDFVDYKIIPFPQNVTINERNHHLIDDFDDDFEAEFRYNAITIFNSEVTAIYQYTSFVQTFSFQNETWVDAVDEANQFRLDWNK